MHDAPILFASIVVLVIWGTIYMTLLPKSRSKPDDDSLPATMLVAWDCSVCGRPESATVRRTIERGHVCDDCYERNRRNEG